MAEKETFKTVMSELGQTSTLHGIPKIVSARSAAMKILWCIMLLGAICIFSIQLYELCDEYYNYPTKTTVRIKYRPLPLPAFTFCNMNPFKRTAVKNFGNLFISHLSIAYPELLKNIIDRYTGKTYFELFNSFNNTWERFDGWKARLLTEIQTLSLQDRIKNGHQLEDFILVASFGEPCQVNHINEINPAAYNIKGHHISSQSFYTTSSHLYGNCFTLDVDHLIAKGSGQENSLFVVFHIEKMQYLEEITSSYGVRLVLHEKGTYPMPVQDGITLSTNYETHISMRMTKIKRLGGKYGNCTYGLHFKEKYNVTYTVPMCYTLCEVENVLLECNCKAMFSLEFMNISARICDFDNDTNCLDNVKKKIFDGQIQCGCFSRCEEEILTTTLSGRKWPHNKYLSKVLVKETCRRNISLMANVCALYENKFFDNRVTQEVYNNISDNFLAVNIYFEDLHFEEISEDPLYNPVRFMSDIGGAMGLYIGASALTCVEVLQLLLEAILFLRRKRKGQAPDGQPEQVNNIHEHTF